MASDQSSNGRTGLLGRLFSALLKKGTSMSLRKIDNNYYVAGQIRPEHIPQLVEGGFTVVICMRPDGEGFGQPGFTEIETAAKAAGIEAHYLPVGGGIPMEHASKMKAILRDAQGKVLGYCASGGRSTMLYQLARQAAA